MFQAASNIPDNLEERFSEPDGWRWHGFTREERKIRYGSLFPRDNIPNAVVVCLPGLSEYGEKYYETARWCQNHNLAFWVIDWMGQGLSGRYLDDPHKRHCSSFQDDIEDLHHFIKSYVKPASVHPDKGRIPLAMLAHSMGSNIGLHYLAQHPDMFECAAFSAPMTGITALKYIPFPFDLVATSTLSAVANTSYVPGGTGWSSGFRVTSENFKLSGDEMRGQIHNDWLEHNPELRIGSPTIRWLHSAAISCYKLNKRKVLRSIHTHCIAAVAGKDFLVDNAKTNRFFNALNHSQIFEYPESYHEILMERDFVRDDFLNQFDNLITKKIIERPETLKPF